MVMLEGAWCQVPVTALCCLPGCRVLVGQGQNLQLLDTNTGARAARTRVFRGAVVHSLELVDGEKEEVVVVRGGKSVAVVRVLDTQLVTVVQETVMEDWIIASRVTRGQQLQLLTAHNQLVTVAGVTQQLVPGEERAAECGPCILYSGHIHCREGEAGGGGGLLVLAGTVFGAVLVWRPDTGTIVNTLRGHDGVIFSVAVAGAGDTVVTTSDDRSCIVYRSEDPGLARVSQLHRLYGHTARVFRSLVSSSRGLVVTAGEDGRLVTWDLGSGRQLEAVETGGGAAVWSLALQGDCVLSGAGDGSVTRTSISSQDSVRPVEVECGGGKPRIVKCLGDRILILDDEGSLFSHQAATGELQRVYSDTRLASYCLLAAAGDRVIMCGLAGVAVSGTLSGPSLTQVVSRQVLPGKVFSCAVLSEEMAAVCDGEGEVTTLRCDTLGTVARGQLPGPGKWFTTSCQLEAWTVLGDRAGGVTFLGPQLGAGASWARLHGRHGVTELTRSGDLAWAAGRDGHVSCFTGGAVPALVTRLRLGQDWVAGVREVGGELAALAWHGDRLVVSSLASGGLVTSVRCGGGHRSWDTAGTSLAYIKEGRVAVVAGALGPGRRRAVLGGGHSQQVNCVHQCEGLLVTGSEDTLLRVWAADTGAALATLRGHLSSVKCAQLTRAPGTSDLVLASGGGRAELRLWRLARLGEQLVSRPLATAMVRPGAGGRGTKKAWRLAQAETQMDGETRFMAVDTVWEGGGAGLLVGVACSDGCVRMYRHSSSEGGLQLVTQPPPGRHCLLQLRLVTSGLLLTGSTGGQLAAWRLAGDKLSLETQLGLHQSGVNCVAVRGRGEESVDIVTGGDDTSLALARYTRGELAVVWRGGAGGGGHAAQVTGVRVAGDLVLSVGADQRLLLWTLGEDSLSWAASRCLSVADISGLDTWTRGRALNIAVVGVGMEMLTLDMD